MSEIKQITVLDSLKQRACAGKAGVSFDDFLRKIKLSWDDRSEPVKGYMQDRQNFYPVSIWQRMDGTPEPVEDVLLEAEQNGLNPGLQEERQGYRDALGIVNA